MELYKLISFMIYNILSVYVGVRIIELFLIRNYRRQKMAIFLYSGTWLINSIVSILDCGIIFTRISIVLCFIILAFFLYEGDWKIKVVAVTSSIVMGIIVENIVWMFSNTINKPIVNEALGCLCSGILEMLIVILIEKLLSLEHYTVIPIYGYINIILLSVASVILAEIVTEEVHNYKLSMIALNMICILNISTYYIYRKIAENHKRDLQRTILIQENQMYTNQLKIMQQSQQYIRILRHDMKNHLQLIKLYLSEGEYEKAMGYCGKLEEEKEITKEYVRTGNITVDSILNYKLNYICRKFKCEIICSIDIPSESVISEVDLNIILGNLLDNAADALAKVEKKILDIKIKYERGILYISIYNSYNGKIIVDKRGKLLTGKLEKENHGLGLESVERIVKKYNGISKISYEEHIFKIDIMLYKRNAVENEL